jgi:hypothetical protein
MVKMHKAQNERGLGIINLRSQNIVLVLKHLDKFYNKCGIPWINLITLIIQKGKCHMLQKTEDHSCGGICLNYVIFTGELPNAQ